MAVTEDERVINMEMDNGRASLILEGVDCTGARSQEDVGWTWNKCPDDESLLLHSDDSLDGRKPMTRKDKEHKKGWEDGKDKTDEWKQV